MKYVLEFEDTEANGLSFKCIGEKNGTKDEIEDSSASFVVAKLIEWLNMLEKKSSAIIHTIQ
jgi:hypothetical protein